MTEIQKPILRVREAVLLFVAALVAYWPALRGGFVFDDSILLLGQPLIRAADGLRRIWFTAEAPDYYPISWTAFWFQWHLWGSTPMGYHVVNVVLHATNAMLLVVVLKRLEIPGSLLAAIIFVLHPVNVAAVAWIIEQKTELAMLFFLLSALAWLRFERERQGKWHALALGSFLISLLAKPAAAMWPFVMLVLVWWRRRRLTLRDVRLSIPFVVLSLATGLAAIWFQSVRVLGGEPARTDPFLARLAGAGWAVWFYIYKTVLLVNLSMIYPRWHIDPAKPLVYVPDLLLVLVVAYCWHRRNVWGRDALAGAGYYVLMLFPVLGFFDQGFYRYSFVADHWQYLAIVGPIVLFASATVRVRQRLSAFQKQMTQSGTVVVLGVLGVLTWNQASIYSSEETLWRDTIAKNPKAWLAHFNLGVTLAEQGQYASAAAAYEAALRIKPDYLDALGNLGMVFAQQGRVDDAIACWRRTAQIKPESIEAHNNLGAAYAQQGKYEQAAREFSVVLQLKPEDADAHANLGTVFINQGQLEKAIEQFRAALVANPHLIPVRLNLGTALARLQKVPEAVEQFQQVLREDPNNQVARSALEQLRNAGMSDQKIHDAIRP